MTDIGHTPGIRGVAVGGAWSVRAQLDSMILVAAAKINPGG